MLAANVDIANKQKVAIGICTYNRAAGLRALLTALDMQRLAIIEDQKVLIVIVDNSEQGSARSICSVYASSGRFASRYISEQRKGLSFARNSGISAANEARATHLAFIDDDEIPDAGWLENLLRSINSSNAAAAIGPVYPIFEVPPPIWLSPSAFVSRRRETDGFVNDGYTCNCIVAMSAIAASNLIFDIRFNETGGEDTVFFRKLIRQGGKIAWAEEAIVHEVVPQHRMSMKWLWRRWYRTGALEAELCKYSASSALGRIFNLTRGLARMVVGSARVIAGSILAVFGRPRTFVGSFYTICRGAGLVGKVFGRNYKEYADPNYQ